jgi:hypothetical protein
MTSVSLQPVPTLDPANLYDSGGVENFLLFTLLPLRHM